MTRQRIIQGVLNEISLVLDAGYEVIRIGGGGCSNSIPLEPPLGLIPLNQELQQHDYDQTTSQSCGQKIIHRYINGVAGEVGEVVWRRYLRLNPVLSVAVTTLHVPKSIPGSPQPSRPSPISSQVEKDAQKQCSWYQGNGRRHRIWGVKGTGHELNFYVL